MLLQPLAAGFGYVNRQGYDSTRVWESEAAEQWWQPFPLHLSQLHRGEGCSCQHRVTAAFCQPTECFSLCSGLRCVTSEPGLAKVTVFVPLSRWRHLQGPRWVLAQPGSSLQPGLPHQGSLTNEEESHPRDEVGTAKGRKLQEQFISHCFPGPRCIHCSENRGLEAPDALKITELLRWEGTLGDHPVQSPFRGTVTWSRWHRNVSRCVLNISREEEFTTSLGSYSRALSPSM